MEAILETLLSFGMKRLDAKIYILLAKGGPHRCKDICNSMKLTKQQAYSSLKNLQEKGIVKTTPERPALYYALPFEKVVENFFTRKLNEIQHIRQSKQELMDNWKSTNP